MTDRILIIGPAWVGDMVMAQTLFKLLKSKQPDVMIDVLASRWTFSLLGRMPEVAKAIEMPIGHGELKLKTRFALARALAKENYDQAIVLPNSFKSALIPWLARIPKRTGWVGEGRYFLLNDSRRLDKNRYPLMIEQYMALGLTKDEPLPIKYPYPAFHLKKEDQAAALLKYSPTYRGRPILALCAGAEFGPAKRWPAEYYADVARQKLADGWDVWLFGSPNDLPITERIMALTDDRCDHLAGRLELAETIDLLSLTSGVVTNDSGLMHIAAALNKPLVALYGATSPAFTPPLSEGATILKLKLECSPCKQRTCIFGHYRCLRDLTPDRVLKTLSAWGHE
ncbi:MAG: lipopolysaccharide heptosyltransferase II [Gammaproteobacteria bacterium RIFCSPHIGHO2_12_FULL_43_28]|nr:MAG: lipopolysaccharide heptosyltransferase II [Gammaproteobacteria bacterium RIFCSPHIGHO2_12_FULL_43_28]